MTVGGTCLQLANHGVFASLSPAVTLLCAETEIPQRSVKFFAARIVVAGMNGATHRIQLINQAKVVMSIVQRIPGKAVYVGMRGMCRIISLDLLTDPTDLGIQFVSQKH